MKTIRVHALMTYAICPEWWQAVKVGPFSDPLVNEIQADCPETTSEEVN